MRKTVKRTLLAGAAVLGLAVGTVSAQAASVADTLASMPQFSKLTNLVLQAGLTDTLRSSNEVTLFAPVDGAFGNLPASVTEALAPHASQQTPVTSELQSLVRIHLLNGAYAPQQFAGRRVTVTDEAATQLQIDGTVQGQLAVVTVPIPAGGPHIFGLATSRVAHVIGPPIAADNGVIYPIDNVLIQ